MNRNPNESATRSSFIHSILVTAASVVLLSGSALAQMSSPGGMPTTPDPRNPNQQAPAQPNMPGMENGDLSARQSMMDKEFVRKALEGGMAEVEFGKLAAQKGSGEQVRQFGQKMVDDHTAMGEKMKPVAEQMNVTIPDKLSKKDAARKAKLESLSGTEFDNEYIKAMVKDHKDDDAAFKREEQLTTDPDLKAVVTDGERVIARHLSMIEQIAKTNNLAAK